MKDIDIDINKKEIIFSHLNKTFDKWKKNLSLQSQLLYVLIENLIDENKATINKDKTIVSINPEGLYYILDNDITLYTKLLQLPQTNNLKLLIIPCFSQVISDKKFELRFCHYQKIEPFPLDCKKMKSDFIFWVNENDEYDSLMTEEEYNVVNLINNFNEQDFDNLKSKYMEYGKICQIVNDSNKIFFDKTLQDQMVYIPNQIKLDIEQDDNGTINLEPLIDCEDKKLQKDFKDDFKKYYETKNVFTVSSEKKSTKRVHIPITKKQEEQLQIIKKINSDRVKGKDISDCLSHPEKHFDLSEIDISDLFYERVIGFGEYQPKTKTFSKKIGNQWFPEIEIIDPINGTVDIVINNKKDLDHLKMSYQSSNNLNKSTVLYKNYKIPIKDAKKIIDQCERQLNNRHIQTLEKKKEILLIKENLEDEEFVEEIKDTKETNYYESVETLAEGIKLKDHQKEGVGWLQNLYTNKEPGCLLADDMGLGKTLEALYLVEWAAFKSEKKNINVLIISPKTLLQNWKDEYNFFFPTNIFDILMLTAEDKDILKNFHSFSSNFKNSTITICTYETLKFNQIEMCKVDWDIVILDEAQAIKTPGTLVTNAVKSLKSNFKLAMTGTPVENSYQDLWCIMDFVLPGLLGSRKEFNKIFKESKDASDDEIKEIGKRIRKSIGIYLKRRDKSVLEDELQPKYLSIEHAEKFNFLDASLLQQMPDKQQSEYEKALSFKITKKDRGQALAAIGHLKKISEHPDFDSQFSFIDYEGKTKKFWKEFANESGKIKAIFPVLDFALKENDKVLIFAEYRFTQYILKLIIENNYNIKNIKIINGDTKVIETKNNNETRQNIVNEFNNSKGFNVLILSPLAAGTGLTITSANHVIHFSRHWNPAKENQATDRAYRIGQKRTVYVYYPMSISKKYDTFDVILNNLLKRKNQLAGSALYPSARNKVTEKDLLSMFENK